MDTYTFCATDFINLTISNKNLGHYMIKPLLRLLKYWNVSKTIRLFSSYELEKIMVTLLSMKSISRIRSKKYLLTGMNELYKLSTYIIRKKDWTRQYINIKEAIKDEEKYPFMCSR